MERLIEINLNEIREQDPELARKVYEIYLQYVKLRQELREARKFEAEARAMLDATITEKEALEKQVEIMKTMMTKMRTQLEEQIRRCKQLELEYKDVLLRSEIAQRSFSTLLDKLDEFYEKLGEKYTEGPIEALKRDMREYLETFMSQVRSLLETLKAPVEVSKPEKK